MSSEDGTILVACCAPPKDPSFQDSIEEVMKLLRECTEELKFPMPGDVLAQEGLPYPPPGDDPNEHEDVENQHIGGQNLGLDHGE